MRRTTVLLPPLALALGACSSTTAEDTPTASQAPPSTRASAATGTQPTGSPGTTGATASDTFTAAPALPSAPEGTLILDRQGRGTQGVVGQVTGTSPLAVRLRCESGRARLQLPPDIDTSATCVPAGSLVSFGPLPSAPTGPLTITLSPAQTWRAEVYRLTD